MAVVEVDDSGKGLGGKIGREADVEVDREFGSEERVFGREKRGVKPTPSRGLETDASKREREEKVKRDNVFSVFVINKSARVLGICIPIIVRKINNYATRAN